LQVTQSSKSNIPAMAVSDNQLHLIWLVVSGQTIREIKRCDITVKNGICTRPRMRS
jgi:hypothetical protein